MTISFFVTGTPAPQGSKSPKGRTKTGRVILVESCKAVKPWRQDVAWAAAEIKSKNNNYCFSGPVECEITFYLSRPASTPKKVLYPIRKPDIDKLVRSTLDALVTSGLIEDDARVVDSIARKRFVEFHCPVGARIHLTAVEA